MFAPLMEMGQQEAYHSGMLVFKLQAEAPLAKTPALGLENAVESSPGIAALAELERAGRLKRVTPLAVQPDLGIAKGLESAVESVAASAAPPTEGDPLAGINLVELERDADVDSLQSALASDPGVEAVSRVPIRYLFARKRATAAAEGGMGILAAAPPFAALWNLAKVRWSEARSLPGFKDAQDIRVAVLDTGIDTGHPDLQGRVVSYTFAHPDLAGVSSNKDLVGHGTHVAGTIAANVNNTIGINGICCAQLHIWKIFDDRPDFIPWCNEYAYFVDPVMYRRALSDCVQQGVQVINLSIGGPGQPDFVERLLFTTLLKRGVTIVAAMGNERRAGNPISYPAAIPGVIAVGATSINDRYGDFSNAGNHIALSTPDVGIWSTLPTYPGQFGFRIAGWTNKPVPGQPIARDTDYASWNGTSMATPHVAAASALLLANRGKMTGADVRERLKATADRVPGMATSGIDPDYGAGRLNLFRLLSE